MEHESRPQRSWIDRMFARTDEGLLSALRQKVGDLEADIERLKADTARRIEEIEATRAADVSRLEALCERTEREVESMRRDFDDRMQRFVAEQSGDRGVGESAREELQALAMRVAGLARQTDLDRAEMRKAAIALLERIEGLRRLPPLAGDTGREFGTRSQ